MSRFAKLYGDQPGADVLLTGPTRHGQAVGFGVSVSPAEVRGAIDKNLIQAVQDRLGFEAEQLVNGVHDIDEWYARSVPLVRAVHYAAALAAVGGVNAFNDVHRDLADARVAVQMDYLRNFADELRVGKQKLNGFVPNRARMYADAAVGTYEAVRRDAFKDAEFQLERRVLDAAAEHCEPCQEYAAMGWQPIGSLPEIGATPCSVRCRCTFEYRRDAGNAPAPVPVPSTSPLPPVLAAPTPTLPVVPVVPLALPTFSFAPSGALVSALGDALTTALTPESPLTLFLKSRASVWTAKGSGWVHLDGTRVAKTTGGAFRVIDRLGKTLRTFQMALTALRYVESGGKVKVGRELSTHDVSREPRATDGEWTKGGGGDLSPQNDTKAPMRKGKKLFHGTPKAFDKPLDGSYWTSNEKAANVYLKGNGGHVHVGYLKPDAKVKEFGEKSWTDHEVQEFLTKEEKTELNYSDFIDLVEDNKFRDFLRSKGYEAVQFHEESSMPGDDKAIYHDSVVPLSADAVEHSHKTEIKPAKEKKPKAKKLEHGDVNPMKMRAERVAADIHSDDPAKKAKAEASLEELRRWADEKNIDADKFIRLAGELSNSFDFYYAIRNGKAKKPKSS